MSKYWFNVDTREVEFGHKSAGKHLLGPYDTEAEASLALERAAERTEKWDEEDHEWNTWGDDK